MQNTKNSTLDRPCSLFYELSRNKTNVKSKYNFRHKVTRKLVTFLCHLMILEMRSNLALQTIR